jgi:hypothetical protein
LAQHAAPRQSRGIESSSVIGELGLADRETLAQDRLSLTPFPLLEQAWAQVCQSGGDVGVVGAQLGLPRSAGSGARSFSRDFITIQSRSPRTTFANHAGSVRRCAEIDGSVSVDVLNRVLGLGGSSSLIRRGISM